jgi:hypothetical protein
MAHRVIQGVLRGKSDVAAGAGWQNVTSIKIRSSYIGRSINKEEEEEEEAGGGGEKRGEGIEGDENRIDALGREEYRRVPRSGRPY